jgi:putative heme-binding domain-containing protein
MNDGRVLAGMLLRTVLDEYTYLDAQGGQFKVHTRDIAETRPAAKSIMPEGLVEQLTDQEIRDLMAYLGSRR